MLGVLNTLGNALSHLVKLGLNQQPRCQFGEHLLNELITPPNSKSDNVLSQQRDSIYPHNINSDSSKNAISDCVQTVHTKSAEDRLIEKNAYLHGDKRSKLVMLQCYDPFCASFVTNWLKCHKRFL